MNPFDIITILAFLLSTFPGNSQIGIEILEKSELRFMHYEGSLMISFEIREEIFESLNYVF